MKKEKYVKICPKCGSINITPFSGIYAGITSGSAGSAGELLIDKCRKCNYKGLIPEIKKSGIEKFRKNIKKKK
jgi:ribosomal protein L40E